MNANTKGHAGGESKEGEAPPLCAVLGLRGLQRGEGESEPILPFGVFLVAFCTNKKLLAIGETKR